MPEATSQALSDDANSFQEVAEAREQNSPRMGIHRLVFRVALGYVSKQPKMMILSWLPFPALVLAFGFPLSEATAHDSPDGDPKEGADSHSTA